MSIKPQEKRETGKGYFPFCSAVSVLTPIPESETSVEDQEIYSPLLDNSEQNTTNSPPLDNSKQNVINSPRLDNSEHTDSLQQIKKSYITTVQNQKDASDRITEKQSIEPFCNVASHIPKEEHLKETAKRETIFPSKESALKAKQDVFTQRSAKNVARQQNNMPSSGLVKGSQQIPSYGRTKPQESIAFRIPPCGQSMGSRIRDLLKEITRHVQTNQAQLTSVQNSNGNVSLKHSAVTAPVEPAQEITDTPKYKCTHCNMCYVRRAFLVKHVIGKHDPQNCCLKCVRIFNTDNKYKEHVLNCHSRFKCEICGVVFWNKYNLKLHTDTHRDPIDKQFKCKITNCSFSHDRYTSYKNHMNIHRKENPFYCRKCRKQFSSRCILDRHVKICFGDFGECKKCGTAFSDDSTLYDHMQTCHVDRIFVCPECGKTYKWRGLLSKHLRTNHLHLLQHHNMN